MPLRRSSLSHHPHIRSSRQRCFPLWVTYKWCICITQIASSKRDVLNIWSCMGGRVPEKFIPNHKVYTNVDRDNGYPYSFLLQQEPFCLAFNYGTTWFLLHPRGDWSYHCTIHRHKIEEHLWLVCLMKFSWNARSATEFKGPSCGRFRGDNNRPKDRLGDV